MSRHKISLGEQTSHFPIDLEASNGSSPDLGASGSPATCGRTANSAAASFEALTASRLVQELRGQTVDFHLGVLVFGVRSDRAFNDLAHGRH